MQSFLLKKHFNIKNELLKGCFIKIYIFAALIVNKLTKTK